MKSELSDLDPAATTCEIIIRICEIVSVGNPNPSYITMLQQITTTQKSSF